MKCTEQGHHALFTKCKPQLLLQAFAIEIMAIATLNGPFTFKAYSQRVFTGELVHVYSFVLEMQVTIFLFFYRNKILHVKKDSLKLV